MKNDQKVVSTVFFLRVLRAFLFAIFALKSRGTTLAMSNEQRLFRGGAR